MITGELRNQIDKLWTEFWTGGITNPLTVIEQITYLMFTRLLDITESRNEKMVNRHGGEFKSIFGDKQHLRWGNIIHQPAPDLLPLIRDELFPFFRSFAANGTTFGEYMKDSQLMIVKESLLVSAVNMIDKLPLTDSDTKGDLYEYLLSKLTTAGINGQFRTPRHIIEMMVKLVDPKPNEVVADPACGTAGFLVGTMNYLMQKYTSPEGRIEHVNEDGSKSYTYTGDLLENYRDHIQNELFHGFDFDATMLRICAMNLMLHGVENPDIHYQDSLSGSFAEHFPRFAHDCFDVVLANPPFKGNLDEEDIDPTLSGKVKTKKTELLFLVLMLRMLKLGGRCASIVPDGVLFGSSKAHLNLRKMLVEENQLEGIISLPSGVFKPYAGVSTAVVVFTKGGKTDHVWFYDVQADGYSLDDKRLPVAENDLPDVVARWQKRDAEKDIDRKEKAFFVPVADIRENRYDLSINRYKEIVYKEEEYESPLVILDKLKFIENEIAEGLFELEGLVS